ncbi:MAG: hypothetical protein RL728_503 [Bacteroidota bacterium]|jgi:hypothetical protein
MQRSYIGISGVARAGKDSFARHLKKLLELSTPNKKIKICPLAAPLKQDCESFVREKLNLNVFSDNTEEKSIFRELLVWYGKVKRQQTHGQYWTNLLDLSLENSDVDICIIPDIRYFQYEKDEVPWLKGKPLNCFIHIQRMLPDGSLVPPANMDESINDQIIREYADSSIKVPTFLSEECILNEIQKIVEETYCNTIKVKLDL